MPTPLTTADQIAAAELETTSAISDLLAATEYLVNFSLPAYGLSTAVADSQVLEEINTAHAPLLASITALPDSVHSLSVLLQGLLPDGALTATPSSLSGMVGDLSDALVITDEDGIDVTSAGVFTSSDEDVATVDSSGVVAYLDEGSATITFTHTATGETCAVPVAVSVPVDYAIPLFREDMNYANKNALLANVGAGKFYSSISESAAAAISVDTSSRALYNGFSSLRYDFNPTTSRDTGPSVAFPLDSVDYLWTKKRVKFVPGFSTAGNAEEGNAQAYKLHEYYYEEGSYYGSGRLEITNTTQYDSYFSVLKTPDDTQVAYANQNDPQIVDEWDDDEWYDYVCLILKSADGKTRYASWWLSKDGETPVLMSSINATMTDGGEAPSLRSWIEGANFNQTRSATVSLNRGPTDGYDASVYRNPYGVPAGDLTALLSMLGTDDSIEEPLVAPAAPGQPTAANATIAKRSTLSFPVTLAASRALPNGLQSRYSTDGGSTWIAGNVTEILAPVLGDVVTASVTALTASTAYQVQFAESNPGGVSPWSSTVTGTTTAADLPAYTTGLVLMLDAGQSADVDTDGALVGAMTDLSSTGLVYSQATAANKPSLILDQVNGLPCLRFASDTYMTSGGYNAALAGTKATVFVVMRCSTSKSTDRVVFDNRDASNHGWATIVSKATNSDEPRFTWASSVGGGFSRGSTFRCMAITLRSTGWEAYVDGEDVDGGSTGMTPNTTVASTLGTLASSVGTQTGDFDLAYLLVYNDVLTSTNIDLVMSGIREQFDTP
jgi:hypothetical protein